MFWFPTKKNIDATSVIIKNEFVIGTVDVPRENDYKILKADRIVYDALHRILDYRIANAFNDLADPVQSNDNMRVCQGYVDALKNLKSLLK